MKRTLPTYATLLAMMLMVFAVSGCSDDDDDNNPTNPTGPTDQFDVVATAGDTYFDDYNTMSGVGVNIPAQNFFLAYDADPNAFYVVDLRAADDYANAHIDGAVQFGLGDLMNEIDNLPTDQMIVFTCYSGQTASYATAITNLIGTITGHEARNLKFGASGIMDLQYVRASGNYSYVGSNPNEFSQMFETTPAPAKPAAGKFPTVTTDATSDLEILKARAQVAIDRWIDGSSRWTGSDAANHDPATEMLVNYFSPAAYDDGHLPDAYQYTPKSSILTTGALNTLPTDKPIGFYCYTGQTSAQVAAYLSMLGYDAKTVLYGVNRMCFDDTAINDVQWHGPENDYTSILTGTAFAAK